MDASIKSDCLSLDNLNHILDKSLMDKIKSKGFSQWFPVQRSTIPLLINILNKKSLFRPRDICISSPTGTGKTFCFLLPVVQHLLCKLKTELTVLVILPGTDLAFQVYQEFQEFCKDTIVKVGSAIDGHPLSEDLNSIFYRKHNGNLENAIDILIASPGKLYDLLQNVPEFNVQKVHTLIIDEADRIINSDLEYSLVDRLMHSIYNNSAEFNCQCELADNDQQVSTNFNLFNLKSKRSLIPRTFNGCNLNSYSGSDNLLQILFTATPTTDLEKLHKFKLFRPQFLSFNSQQESSTSHFNLPDKLQQKTIKVSNEDKPAVIWYLIKELDYNQMLIFVNTKEDAHRLVLLLNQYPDFKVYEMTGNINPKERESLRIKFAKGAINAFVCSDVIARGIDIPDVRYVVNYDLPARAHAYVHRVGRTARAGKDGTAITLIAESDQTKFKEIWRKVAGRKSKNLTTQKLDAQRFKPYVDFYANSLIKLKIKVNNEKIMKVSKLKNIISS